jgi:SAM-dependent methyltransferase
MMSDHSQRLYDEVPYPSFPLAQTHPDRLATLATLFGMQPAAVEGCKVLELGCGDGSNLIPMAYALPDSRFTGIDLAAAPIAAGFASANALELANLSLKAADLRDVGPEYGEFDYILAHGVYSWVPPDVRDRLIAICRERLAPQGIAFISYNVYPGRHLRQMLREMLLYHTRNVTGPDQRVEKGRGFLQLLSDSRTTGAWQPLLEREIGAMLERPEGSLFHDDLADFNDPVYFSDFMAHATRHGLQYLGEADLHEMFDLNNSLAWVGNDLLEREQYRDFLRMRSFRQTLLCRDEVALQRQPGAELMDRFHFSAPARTMEDGRIEGLRHIRITPVHEAVNRVVGALGDTYPLPVAFEELVPYAGDREPLREILHGLIMGGFADLHVYDFPCEELVSEKPRASRLVRHQAELSIYVTSACQHVVKLDEVGRHLVCLMDGTRDHNQLVKDLAKVPGMPPAKQIRADLPASLEWLARMTLLEG